MSKLALTAKKLQIKNILVAAYNARASFNLHQLGLISYDRFCVNYITEFQTLPKFDLTNTINWLRDPTTRNNKDTILPVIIDKDNLFTMEFFNDGRKYSQEEIQELEEYLDDTYELLFKI
jgi:hypothetical protein